MRGWTLHNEQGKCFALVPDFKTASTLVAVFAMAGRVVSVVEYNGTASPFHDNVQQALDSEAGKAVAHCRNALAESHCGYDAYADSVSSNESVLFSEQLV